MLSACQGSEDLLDDFDWAPPAAGAVVAEHPLAVGIGLEVLERGGNAADAAVATALALAVCYPVAGNLGGGGFALWVPGQGEPTFLDFRETAPSTADPDLYRNFDGALLPERSVEGPLSVGVPGSPAGLHALHERHGSGRFSFADLVAPAVRLAERGFPVDPWLAYWLRDERTRARLWKSDVARALLYPGDRPLVAGELLVQPELARTLRRLGQYGPDDFYRGRTAERIVRTLRRAAGVDPEGEPSPGERGWVRAEDLAAYRVQWRTPLRGWFRGREVLTAPPPSSGGVVLLEVLALLEHFPLESESAAARASGATRPAWASPRILHWWIEAARLAFADRATYLGDPDFLPQTSEELVASLLDPARVARQRLAIGERAAAAFAPAPPAELAPAETPAEPGLDPDELAPALRGETTHVSVLDAEGNAVSMTTTLNLLFGSGLLVEGGGFFLNDELDDFAILPGAPNEYGLVGAEANALAPGKRPLSSMTPVVVRDGGQTVSMVLGAPGGPRIISAVLSVLLRTVAFGEPLERAVRAPRLHQQWRPSATWFEEGWDGELLRALAERGHELQPATAPWFWASVQAIAVEPGERPTAVSDPRRGGVAGIQGEQVPVTSSRPEAP